MRSVHCSRPASLHFPLVVLLAFQDTSCRMSSLRSVLHAAQQFEEAQQLITDLQSQQHMRSRQHPRAKSTPANFTSHLSASSDMHTFDSLRRQHVSGWQRRPGKHAAGSSSSEESYSAAAVVAQAEPSTGRQSYDNEFGEVDVLMCSRMNDQDVAVTGLHLGQSTHSCGMRSVGKSLHKGDQKHHTSVPQPETHGRQTGQLGQYAGPYQQQHEFPSMDNTQSTWAWLNGRQHLSEAGTDAASSMPYMTSDSGAAEGTAQSGQPDGVHDTLFVPTHRIEEVGSDKAVNSKQGNTNASQLCRTAGDHSALRQQWPRQQELLHSSNLTPDAEQEGRHTCPTILPAELMHHEHASYATPADHSALARLTAAVQALLASDDHQDTTPSAVSYQPSQASSLNTSQNVHSAAWATHSRRSVEGLTRCETDLLCSTGNPAQHTVCPASLADEDVAHAAPVSSWQLPPAALRCWQSSSTMHRHGPTPNDWVHRSTANDGKAGPQQHCCSSSLATPVLRLLHFNDHETHTSSGDGHTIGDIGNCDTKSGEQQQQVLVLTATNTQQLHPAKSVSGDGPAAKHCMNDEFGMECLAVQAEQQHQPGGHQQHLSPQQQQQQQTQLLILQQPASLVTDANAVTQDDAHHGCGSVCSLHLGVSNQASCQQHNSKHETATLHSEQCFDRHSGLPLSSTSTAQQQPVVPSCVQAKSQQDVGCETAAAQSHQLSNPNVQRPRYLCQTKGHTTHDSTGVAAGMQPQSWQVPTGYQYSAQVQPGQHLDGS